MIKRAKYVVLLTFILLWALGAAAPASAAKLTHENQLWDSPSWSVIPTSRDHYLTRQEIADNMGIYAAYGFDENFAWYSEQTQISAQNDGRRWAARFQIGGAPKVGDFYFNLLSDTFVLGVDLTVYKHNNSYISLLCGNMTRVPDNPLPPRISGYKWNDLNENGSWDPGEPPLAGWTIRLHKDGQSVRSTSTDGQGYYEFIIDARAELTPGLYSLTEDMQPGWRMTQAPAPVDVQEGLPAHNYSGNNFGNFHPGRVSGRKWDDSNANGSWDAGEKPLANWPISLYSNGFLVGTVQTAADGSYEFTNLSAGTYSLWEASVTNWRQTYPLNQGAPPVAGLETGAHQVAIASGSNMSQLDFGNVELGSITKTVADYWWATPLAGATITLEEVAIPGVLINEPALPITQTSTTDGATSFAGLLPGEYRLTVLFPDGIFPEPMIYEHIIILPEGETTEIPNYTFAGEGNEPRTIGFWKHWRKSYTNDEMIDLINRVQVGSGDFAELSLDNIDSYLSTKRKKRGPQQMATTQYLALWLNIASERLGFRTVVDISTIDDWRAVVEDLNGPDDGIMSVHFLMQGLVRNYNSGDLTPDQWEIFKDICDWINNSVP